MDLEYIKIHVCRNDCILYKKEYEKLDQCLKYGEPCYKVKANNGDDYDNVSKKRPLAKVLWYLPMIPRFKILFSNADDARILDGV